MAGFRWVVLASVLLVNFVSDSAADGKLNVLFIAVDDLRPELGCYGNTLVQTPHIDSLAAAGVRFERAYCQFPLCNPSRTSLLTGRHPNTTGVFENSTYFRTAHPDWVSLPQFFKNNGYVAARTGKIFHGGIDDTEAWTTGGEARVDQKTRKKQNPANSDRIVKLDGDGQSHGDYRTATRAVELLEEFAREGEAPARPFFLAVGFTKPHSPPTAPAKLFELYDPAKIPLPPDFASIPTVPPGFPEASVTKRSGDLFIGREASPAEAREVIRAYHASLTFADTQIGRVLAALDRLKLRDKTVIVFFGDHGYHLGEKGKWSKHGSVFEVAARVPMIVCAPGGSAGKSSPRTVQLLDIYPTLAELCGLTPPAGLEGHSLVPLVKDPQAAWSHPAYTVCNNAGARGQSVRTERWRYSEWNGGAAGAVLFDEQADPHEMKNLADDPAHKEVVAEMKGLLAKLPKR
jgi:arylsulfatase A-like enzyme